MKICKNGCKADRLVRGYCPRCYQKRYENEKKLLSTTRAPKNKITEAQAKAKAMKFSYKPHNIQRWTFEQIVDRWNKIKIWGKELR